MASVYKTLSGAEKDEKETGEKRNKQRVLILVRIHAPRKVRPMLIISRVQEALPSDTDICYKTCTR
jgi:hypothetical protein